MTSIHIHIATRDTHSANFYQCAVPCRVWYIWQFLLKSIIHAIKSMDTMNSIRSKIFKCVYIVEWIETIRNQRWECRCARSRDVSMCAHGIEFVMFGLHYSTGWRCPNWSYKISATSTMHTMAWPSNRSHQTLLFNEYYSFWMHQYQLTNLNVTSLSCHLINDVQSLSIAIDVVATWHYRFFSHFLQTLNVQIWRSIWWNNGNIRLKGNIFLLILADL